MINKIKSYLILNWKKIIIFLAPIIITIPIISYFIVKNINTNNNKIKESSKQKDFNNFPNIDIKKYDNLIERDKNNNKIITEKLFSLIIKDVIVKFSEFDINISYSTKIINDKLGYIFFRYVGEGKLFNKNFKISLQ